MNSSTETKDPQNVLLKVSFDIDQLNNRLVWAFDDESPLTGAAKEGSSVVNAFHREGRHAGSVHFNQGDVLTVDLLGLGGKDFVAFSVLDCTLVTMPMPYLRVPSPPSPFGIQTATQELVFTPAQPDKARHGRQSYLAQGTTALTVSQSVGVWDFSLYLTVQITRLAHGGPDTTTEFRVFRFDPESEVGTGVTR